MNTHDNAPTASMLQLQRYFRSLGIVDVPTLNRLTNRVLDECDGPEFNGRSDVSAPAIAIAHAQRMVQGFLDQLDIDRTSSSRHWLPVFLRAHADSFPDDPAAARRFAELAGGPDTSVYHGFHAQHLLPNALPRWLAVVLPSVILGAAVAYYAVSNVGPDLSPILVGVWATLIAGLTALVLVGLTSSLIGFFAGSSSPSDGSAARHRRTSPQLPPTAVVMPIYHEDAERVIAGLVALWEGLRVLPGGSAFEFFVLSDSRDAEHIRRENHAIAWLRQRGAPDMPLYYRRRADNHHRKAGNLAEFFSSVGRRFTYAVLLDADSVMRPETVLEMVNRMEDSPKVGLLQAPLQLLNARTYFARAQQFTSAVVGPMASRGLATWSQDVGNYYGHNAVVRVSAFVESCALPVLQGRPPLGGELLSHDFVEAAMLSRAGWEVRIAHDLGGSWEECPPALTEFVARDRRWCQGNLQHLRILRAGGLRMMSRLHLLLGAAAYLAAPALVLFLVLGFAMTSADSSGGASKVGFTLTVAAIGALVATRVLAWLDVISSGVARSHFGGAGRFTVSAVIDGVTAAVLGPLLMIHHSVAVISILAGRSSGWGAQRRVGGSSPVRTAVRSELFTTLVGLGVVIVLTIAAPGMLWWTAPLWLPLTVAVPISLVTGSRRVGAALARTGLLLVPTELSSEPVWVRTRELAAQLPGEIRSDELRNIVLDPILLAEHCRTLAPVSGDPTVDLGNGRELRERAAQLGPFALTQVEHRLLLADQDSLRWLHEKAWSLWDATPAAVQFTLDADVSPSWSAPAITVDARSPALRLSPAIAVPSI